MVVMIATSLDKRVHLTTSLGLAGDEVAQQYLAEMKRRADPILHERQWRILELREFYPRSKQLLGLNMNRGQEVSVRLRDANNKARFLPFEAVMGTMLHEMAHCAIGPHNASFWALYRALVEDCERREVAIVAAASGGPVAPRVGDSPWETVSSAIPKELKPFSGSGRRLGGTVRIMSLEALRDARAELVFRLRRPILSLQASGGEGADALVTEQNANQGSCALSQPCCASSNEGPANEHNRVAGLDSWGCKRCGHTNISDYVLCEICADEKEDGVSTNTNSNIPSGADPVDVDEATSCDDDEVIVMAAPPTRKRLREEPRNPGALRLAAASEFLQVDSDDG